MNSCVLMAKIIDTPQLRYTQDTQRPFTELLVEFEALRPNEPPATLRVIGWGSLATEIEKNFHPGDQVILEGRLSINRFERQGVKETRSELVISHIYHVEGQIIPAVASTTTDAASRKDNVVAMNSFKSKPSELPATEEDIYQPTPTTQIKQPARQPATEAVSSPDPLPRETPNNLPNSSTEQVPYPSEDEQDLDDIPFVRAAVHQIGEVDLQDSWELNANRPGIWLHGVRDLWI